MAGLPAPPRPAGGKLGPIIARPAKLGNRTPCRGLPRAIASILQLSHPAPVRARPCDTGDGGYLPGQRNLRFRRQSVNFPDDGQSDVRELDDRLVVTRCIQPV